MKKTFLLICITAIAASCEKYTCHDEPVRAEIIVEQADSFLAYSLTQYAKGTTNVVSTKEDTAFYRIENVNADLVNYDWKIDIHKTGNAYTISNVHYKTKKGGHDFNLGSAHSAQCSNDLYYTLNGVERYTAGQNWNKGVTSPTPVVISITKDTEPGSRL
jgi:hypothetical protein